MRLGRNGSGSRFEETPREMKERMLSGARRSSPAQNQLGRTIKDYLKGKKSPSFKVR